MAAMKSGLLEAIRGCSSWQEIQAKFEADMLASLIALRKAMMKHPIRHAVSFHSTIHRADLFQEILTTLRSLAANDERIIDYFRAVLQGRQHRSGGSVEFDLDERISRKIDLSQFVKDIELNPHCSHSIWPPAKFG